MFALRLILLALSLSLSTMVLAQNTYRWVDKNSGQTVYSDHPPPVGAKDVVIISGASVGVEQQTTYATRTAAEKFPAVLYSSGNCGEACVLARELLTQRSIPFAEKILNSQEEMDEFSRLFGGKMTVPSITVGQQKLVGFEKGAWNNLLDLAGYPKSGGKPAAK